MSHETAMTKLTGAAASVSVNPWPGLSRKESFYEDEATAKTLARIIDFVQAGVCVNLSGHAGLGKTTLALRAAEEIGRPVSFMTGNQWLTTRDFIGREVGQTERTLVDRYVQSVRRTESESRADWKSAILATSMLRGYTLVYDEFSRASPEANAALLSVIEEGVLVSTDRASDRSYITAHPDFRIILTSNPHDYAGVKSVPDAMLDRVVTLRLEDLSLETMAGIVTLRTGLDPDTATRVCRVVLGLQAPSQGESRGVSALRTAMMIAKVVVHRIRSGTLAHEDLVSIIHDVAKGRGIPADNPQIDALLAPEKLNSETHQ